MSNKSSKPSKKLSVPREMPEINKEYQQTCAALGQAEYQAFILQEETAKLKERLRAVNQEANARQQLDLQSKVAAGEVITEQTALEQK